MDRQKLETMKEDKMNTDKGNEKRTEMEWINKGGEDEVFWVPDTEDGNPLSRANRAETTVPASGGRDRTGEEREEMIFGKRSSLARTPPETIQWTPQTSTSVGTDETGEEDYRLSKRKRRESPKEKEERNTKVVDEVMQAIWGINETAKELVVLVKNNPNTKVEIKRMVAKLERQVESLNRRSAGLRPIRIERPRPESRAVGVQTIGQPDEGVKKLSKPKCRSAGVQTEERLQGMERSGRDRKEVTIRVLKQIRECRTEADILECMREDWPEEVFSISSEEVGNPLDKDEDLTVFTGEAKLEKGIGKWCKQGILS